MKVVDYNDRMELKFQIRAITILQVVTLAFVVLALAYMKMYLTGVIS